MRHTIGAARPDAAWRWIAVLVAGLSLWMGIGYAIGGRLFTQSAGWGPLLSLLDPLGGLHAHGVIMFLIGFALALQLRGPYDVTFLWTLRIARTYALIVTATWFGSWFTVGISWGAPAWWLLLAALTVWLTSYAPALTPVRHVTHH